MLMRALRVVLELKVCRTGHDALAKEVQMRGYLHACKHVLRLVGLLYWGLAI
jgi:hypothetical protein